MEFCYGRRRNSNLKMQIIMANFQTHFTGATVTASLAASTILSLNIVDKSQILPLWLFAVVGGLMPDIDSDDSTSIRLIFNLFGLVGALLLGLMFYAQLSIVGLWLLGCFTYIVVRYVFIELFESITVHRGSIHSLLICVMFSLATVLVTHLWSDEFIYPWCAGIFMLIGMLTHLTLDECYSVDLSGMEIKRSFGSALKPLSLDYPIATGGQLLVCGGLIYFLPTITPFIDAISAAQFSFMPDKEWAWVKGGFG